MRNQEESRGVKQGQEVRVSKEIKRMIIEGGLVELDI